MVIQFTELISHDPVSHSFHAKSTKILNLLYMHAE